MKSYGFRSELNPRRETGIGLELGENIMVFLDEFGGCGGEIEESFHEGSSGERKGLGRR